MPDDARRVLIVEDDPGIRSLMLAVVRRDGFEAEVAVNGIEAIAVLARERFAVIILDLLLPRSSGYDVLEWLESAAPNTLTRVLILSATSPSIVRKHAVARRVYRVMQKPFDIQELLAAVHACASREESHDPFRDVRMKSSQANAEAAVVVVRDHDALRLVWSFGYEPETLERHNPLPLSVSTPIGTSVVEARPVWMRTRADIVSAYPGMNEMMLLRTRALAAVPIVEEGVAAGSIGFSFIEEQPFDDGQQRLLQAIADDCVPVPKTISG